MKQIQISQYGGPEAMKLVDVPKPSPGPGQALVKVAASGVNFIDVYFRSGHYKADLPFTVGSEASGRWKLWAPVLQKSSLATAWLTRWRAGRIRNTRWCRRRNW